MRGFLPRASVVAALRLASKDQVLSPLIRVAASEAAADLNMQAELTRMARDQTGSRSLDAELILMGVELAEMHFARGETSYFAIDQAMAAEMKSIDVPERKWRPYLTVWFAGAHGIQCILNGFRTA